MKKRFSIPRDEVEFYIDQWCFNEKYRHILKRRFLDGLTFDELAEEFDMSPRHIQKIVKEEGDIVLLHVPLYK